MILKKKLSASVLGGVVLTFCVLQNANAIFPTFDITEVAQTISSANSQVQSVLNSAQSTIAQVNIQQSIGDSLGGLSKFKDLDKLKKKIEKAKKKADAAKKRYENAKKKYDEAKKKYETVKKEVTDTVNEVKNKVDSVKEQVENTVDNVKEQVNNAQEQVNNVKEQVNNVKEQVNNVKEQVNNVKGQVENAVGQVKSGYEQAVSTYEQTKNVVETKVSEVKGTVEGYKAQAEGAITQIKDQSVENVSVSGVQTQTFDIDERSLDAVSVDDLWNSSETAANAINKISVQGRVNVPVSGVQTQTFDIDERSLDAVSVDDLWNSSETAAPIEAPKTIKTSPAKAVLPENKVEKNSEGVKKPNLERTSFKKVSYLQNLPVSLAAESSAFTYGTNTDTGRFVISNTMAEWCNINFDEEDENIIAECIKTMVTDMHNPDSTVAAEYRTKFEQVKKETLEAMIVIAAVNSSYSGGFEESVAKDLEDKSDATDTVRDNVAYLSEVERANQEIQRRMLDVQPIALMYQTLEAIGNLDGDVYSEE